MSIDPESATAKRAREKRAENAFLFDLPLDHAVSWTLNAGQPGSPTQAFYDNVIQVRCSQLQAESTVRLAEATDRLAKSNDETAQRLANLTRSYVNATWALAALTAVLVGLSVFQALR